MRPEDVEANAERCVCPSGCPTYDDCAGQAGERLYCSRGRTACALRARGCICPGCAVWIENDLGSTYFCLEGAAAE